MSELIEKVQAKMKEERPADLDSSLTIMCDYAKELIVALEKATDVEAAAKALQDLRDYKVLNGKDKHYLKSKLRLWSDLELALHNNGKCEASCGFCAFEAERAKAPNY